MRISSLDLKLIFFCAVRSNPRENSSLTKREIQIRSILSLEVATRFTRERCLYNGSFRTRVREHAGAELLREGGDRRGRFSRLPNAGGSEGNRCTRGGLTTGGFDR